MCDPIILDDVCLRNGLPPLSMGQDCAMEMIRQMKTDQKRKVLRKIRKIAKTEISRRCRLIKSSQKRKILKKSLERQANLGKDEKLPHRALFINRRLLLVRQFFESTVST